MASRRLRHLPGVTGAARTDLPVMKPYRVSTDGPDPMLTVRWLASLPPWTPVVLLAFALIWPTITLAQTQMTVVEAWSTLFKWVPFIVGSGFVFTVLISVLAMLIGTVLGAVLGLAQISPNKLTRAFAWSVTQLFRNSPWLVLLFVVLLALPSNFEVLGFEISVPAWLKAVFGLSLPIMANISEIVRGAIQSVPTAQWEASESLAFSRGQTLWRIILPQCFKRMIPPWMNWYAILTMATPLCSILGVEETITLTQQALEAENNRPDLLVPFYGFALIMFFVYCYPIARWTVALERRYAVKL
ncbi:MAG: amino acid ABC transporter permease [Pseudomonadota bacterium]